MSEPEPRRSVRSTKGQHKALDQLDQPAEPKKRGRKPSKRAEEKQQEPEEEIIRCVCGATEQDEDSGEPWIACDKCGAWQHNVCMGMSVYSEDLPKEYFCEICKPEDHKELLDGIARGEKPWEERRKAYEEEKANEKRKKGGRKAKPKKSMEPKEDASKASPVPEGKKEAKSGAGTKRKSRGASEEHDGKAPQKRKVSETQALPVYNPPEDIPATIAGLYETRQTPAKALLKAMTDAVALAEKKQGVGATDGLSTEARTERLALQIERAVHDAYPNHKEYAARIRTLRFNLKENTDLCNRLVKKTLTPPMLAVMTSDQLASKELQQKTAKMKAQAERQSILGTDDSAAPRVRRTHKGEEVIENDSSLVASEEKPSAIRRQSVREALEGKASEQGEPMGGVELPADLEPRQASPKENLRIDTQQSPRTDFDIHKVFSSVRSPTAAHQRRPSQAAPPSGGPGVDPEVDRLLQDEREESPPYSPAEETDPDIIWKGTVGMSSVANFEAVAKYAAGCDLGPVMGIPWTTLIPQTLTVAGRIDERKATEYLCSLRYSLPTDLSVIRISPATEFAKPDFLALVDYFVSRKRYGVVGDKGVGNVRDTYLIPLPPGTGNLPEFMLPLADNLVPETRAVPMLLMAIVYRSDYAGPDGVQGAANRAGQQVLQSPATASPVPAAFAKRNASISAPSFSPTSPQGPFPATPTPTPTSGQAPLHLQHPLSQPLPQHLPQNPPQHPPQYLPPQQGPPAHTPAAAGPSQYPAPDGDAVARENAQRQGEALAREVLGPFISCPTVAFLLPQASKMHVSEWLLIRTLYEQEPRTREDLAYLSHCLEKRGEVEQNASAAPPATPTPTPPAPPAPGKTPQTPVPVPQIPHSAVPPPRAVAVQPSPAPAPQPTAAPPA